MHKLLLTELLKGGKEYERFLAKQAKFEAALDYEEEGGVTLEEEIFDDEELEEVEFKAMKPSTPPDTPISPAAEAFPPLATHRTGSSAGGFDIATSLGGMSLDNDSKTTTVVGSPTFSPPPSSFRSTGESIRQTSTTLGSSMPSTRQPKAWGSRDGKAASSVLFLGAKPTPAPAEFDIAAYDNRMDQEHGPNLMKTRFWDPTSNDFNPDRFYDAVVNKYNCPFTCE